MATAQISARVRIDLDGPEQFPYGPELPAWTVTAFTLDHPEGEYVHLTLEHQDGRESEHVRKATLLAAHVLPLLSSARVTLRVIQQLQAVTTEAVR